ncbi:uncharacterized protein LOC129583793 [Paramacrobiotus metropolitanus]|uniref:uncharacterized protein LOC129583793 n=1 Tax=Paramacrobiotus metropolitanus TaxID=2943436 RepID=UPI002445EC69|nr:uncharacterized protein LOC129583793 [Paramacrobiotus metropolitanus]
MNATSLYFRQLFTGSREVNYGNTVLVQRDNGQWWLGYVQDIDGDRFFIDFDASTIHAQWIHTRHIWPHHFLSSRKWPMVRGKTLQVAMRQHAGGPMVFRSGTVTGETNVLFRAMRLDDHNRGGKNPCEIVYQNHFVESLPATNDGGSFFGRTTGYLYRKHVISFPDAGLLPEVDFLPTFLGQTSHLALNSGADLCDTKCRFRRTVSLDTSVFFCQGRGSHRRKKYSIDLACRVFARAEMDTVTFICAEMHDDAAGRSMFWDEATLKKACKNYLRETQKSECVHLDRTSGNALEYELEEMSISELPHPIVTCILLYLDIYSQAQTRRVCALWRLIFRKYINKRHILFDLCASYEKQPRVQEALEDYNDYRTYELITMLNGILPRHTHTLALTQDENHTHANPAEDALTRMWTIKTVFEEKDISLPLIILKNGRDQMNYTLLDICCNPRLGSSDCVALSKFWSVCEQLVLIGYNASDALKGSACRILFSDVAAALPDSEIMRSKITAGCDIIVPLLHFHSTQTAAEQCRIFLTAANDSCPAVSQRVFERVTAMHKRWVQTLKYPDDWVRIRVFLQLFNSFGLNDDPQGWDTMDLRQLHIASLTNVTFAVLDSCFED